jgi:GTP-binding protein
VILHVVDLYPPEGAPSPAEAYRTIRNELEKYSPTLAERPELIIGNKMDLTDADVALDMLREELGDSGILGISAAAGLGLRELSEAMWSAVEQAREVERSQAPEPFDLEQTLDEPPDEESESTSN